VKAWVRGAALPLCLTIGASFAAPLATAQELVPTAAPVAPNPKPVATAAAAKVAALPPNEAAFATTQAASSPATGDSKSFFKSPRGILAVTLAAAGVGYVIYSSHNDRVHSQIR
jgi:streptogramin lyase